MATKKSEAEPGENPEIYISRSEKKRQAKGIEALAGELAELPATELRRLPCPDPLKDEIKAAHGLKGGALKRQVKFIAKELRATPNVAELFQFLEERKGSRLKAANELHELEQLREAIITEALQDWDAARQQGERLNEDWEAETVLATAGRFPELDVDAVHKSALRYAATRKPVHRREIFRLLQAAMERQRFAERAAKSKND